MDIAIKSSGEGWFLKGFTTEISLFLCWWWNLNSNKIVLYFNPPLIIPVNKDETQLILLKYRIRIVQFCSVQFSLSKMWIEEIGEDGVDSFVYDITFTHWVVSIGNI